MLDRLEKTKLARLAIPNLTLFWVGGLALAWIVGKANPEFLTGLVLVPANVLQGEVWRLVSFLFMPPAAGWLGDIGILFGILILFMFGRALEGHLGTFKYNAFLLLGWVLTIAVAWIQPHAITTNLFLIEIPLLAFAYVQPDYVIHLMLVLPVKMKWVALLVWGSLLYLAVQTGALFYYALWATGPVTVLAFFGKDMWLRVRGQGRRVSKQREQKRAETTATHTCAVCAITDLSHPDMQFRYCSKCEGGLAYCQDHLRDHEHVGAA